MGWRALTDIRAYVLSVELRRQFGEVLARSAVAGHRKFCEGAHEAVASPARNIAEGFGRYGRREFARFATIALASHRETQTYLEEAHERRFLTDEEFADLWALSEEATATTVGLVKSLKRHG